MKATRKLHDIGQSLWLDDISRNMLNDAAFRKYIDDPSVIGLTSNPTIFDHAIRKSAIYDDDISQKAPFAKSAEELFLDLAFTARSHEPLGYYRSPAHLQGLL